MLRGILLAWLGWLALSFVHLVASQCLGPAWNVTSVNFTGNASDVFLSSNVTCPSDVMCSQLSPLCIQCDCNEDCVYGEDTQAYCQPLDDVECEVGGVTTPSCRL